MSETGASEEKTDIPQAAKATLPAWIKGLGAVLLIALIYTSYQMVQTQQRFVQADSERSGLRKAASEAQDTRAQLVREVSSLKSNLTAARTSLGKLEGELKDASARQKLALQSRQEGEKQAASLRAELSAEKTSLGKAQGQLKDAGARLKLALAESNNNKMAAEKQQAMALHSRQEGEKRAASLRERLSAEKTRLGRLQGELRDAGARLKQAMAESSNYKNEAETQQKLAQEYKEQAERAAAQPAQ